MSAGTIHNFHTVWIGAITTILNDGLLPNDYYALSEQDAGNVGPEVLTLRANEPAGEGDAVGVGAVTAVTEAPPKVQFTATTEVDFYALKQHTLVIRHSCDDSIIALLEILSPGNRSSRKAFRAFLDKHGQETA